LQGEGGGDVLFGGEAEFFDPLADFSVAGAALGFEGGADFDVGKLAAGDHEKAEGDAVGGLGRRWRDAQAGELVDEGGLEALGLAIEGSLKKGAVGAATVLEALPEGLGVAGTGGERARGLGKFAMVALKPVGGRGERLEKVFHGAVILGVIVAIRLLAVGFWLSFRADQAKS
jgi:hypothetical protein